MIEEQIVEKLNREFQPLELEVVNESHQHSGGPGRETHFKVLVVSEKFNGLSRILRQRAVYQTLDYELKNGVHALTIRALSPEEFDPSNLNFQSPDCAGGSKRELKKAD